jgi:hypothetical protein
MSKSRRTETQMIGALKQLEAAVKPRTWREKWAYRRENRLERGHVAEQLEVRLRLERRND